MEEFIDLIIIIAIFAISIVSSVNKAKKQKAKQNAEPQHMEGGEDDPWASIKKYLEDKAGKDNEDYEYEEDDYEEEVVPRKVTVQAAASPVPATFEYNGSPEFTPANSGGYYEITGRNNSVDNKMAGKKMPVQAPVTDTETSNAFDGDFDLRAAIIYSEILKPKFEE